MTKNEMNTLAASAANDWCRCFKCDRIVNETGLHCVKPCGTCTKWFDGYKIAMIALEKLEKQKEQKPEVNDPFDDEQFRRGYEAGKHDAMREQKPAEWSEEDEKKITFLERLIRYNVPEGQYGWVDGHRGGFVTKLEAISMLKSLRPSWKPSEEQLLKEARNHFVYNVLLGNDMKKMIAIYNDEVSCKPGDVVRVIVLPMEDEK